MTLPTRLRSLLARRPSPRWAVVALIGASILGGLATAPADGAPKAGVVKTKRGDSYAGDVDEAAVEGKVVVIGPTGGRTELFKQAVDTITYFASLKDEFDYRFAHLPPKDVPSRIALAKWAMGKKEYDLAAKATAEAKAVNPAAPDVAVMEKQIAASRPAPSTTQASTNPTTGPTAEASFKQTPPAKRLLTADEIQIVRQREMRPGDRTVKMQLPPELKKAAAAAGVITQAEIRTIAPMELATRVLKENNPDLTRLVKFQTDPIPLTEYRQKINRFIVSGCASTACHSPQKGGKFVLFAPFDKEEAALTNFVILQKWEGMADGAQRPMINRTQVGVSLLLGYMLPPEASKLPHPIVPGYKGIVRTVADPTYTAVTKWMGETLSPTTSTYEDIDLAVPPPPATRPSGK